MEAIREKFEKELKPEVGAFAEQLISGELKLDESSSNSIGHVLKNFVGIVAELLDEIDDLEAELAEDITITVTVE